MRINHLVRRLLRLDPNQVRFWSSPVSKSTTVITHDNALTVSTFWACVRLVSDTIASLPFHVMREQTNGDKVRERDHPVDFVIGHRPNRETTAFDFWQTIVAHVLIWGNAYAEIERNTSGTVLALWILPPDRIQVMRSERGEVVYDFNNGEATLPAHKVLHIKGLGFDGLVGYSVVAYMRQQLGLAMATEEFGSNFFGNGAHPSAIVSTDEALNDDTVDRMQQSYRDQLSRGNWLKPIIMHSGLKWQATGTPPEDAQFLETRKFQAEEIARAFRCPPHKVGLLDKATFNNIEHQSIEFVTDTLRPWIVKIEQEVDVKLMPRSLKSRGLFSRINTNALLKGDMKAQQEAFSIGVRGGWLSPNDVRRFLDLNGIGKVGDTYMVQAQMVPIEVILERETIPGAAPVAEPDQDEDDKTSGEDGAVEGEQKSFAPVKILSDALKRIHRKEMASKHFATLGEKHRSWAQQGLVDAAACFVSSINGKTVDEDEMAQIRTSVLGWLVCRLEDAQADENYDWDVSVGREVDELMELLT